MLGILLGLTVCSVAFVHAISESRAFARVDSSQDTKDVDVLWLMSCVAFIAFEAVAVGCAFTSEGSPAFFAEVPTGVIACLAGVRIRCVAIARLGAGFAQPPLRGAAPLLAQDDVYAIVRHPSELGLLLFCAGLVMIVPIAQVLCAFGLLVVPFVAFRIAREERWLGTHRELRHSDFRAAVPRLLCPRPRDLFALISLLAHGRHTRAEAEAAMALSVPHDECRSGFSRGGRR